MSVAHQLIYYKPVLNHTGGTVNCYTKNVSDVYQGIENEPGNEDNYTDAYEQWLMHFSEFLREKEKEEKEENEDKWEPDGALAVGLLDRVSSEVLKTWFINPKRPQSRGTRRDVVMKQYTEALQIHLSHTSKYAATGGGGNRIRTPAKSTKHATTAKVRIGRRNRIVYEGPRGGRYVKVKGRFVSLRSGQ
jgi:hypothetical protein